MKDKNPDQKQDQGQDPGDVPEDVASLYSWANADGARYRDYSSLRRGALDQLKHSRDNQPADAGIASGPEDISSVDRTHAAGAGDDEADRMPPATPEQEGIGGGKAPHPPEVAGPGGISSVDRTHAAGAGDDEADRMPPATPEQEEVGGGKAPHPPEVAGPGVAPPRETSFPILRMPRPAEADDSATAQTAAAAKGEPASNWFALQGVLRPSRPRVVTAFSGIYPPTPAVAIFSISGGSGKTSLTASLGRALAAYGEHVLLADLTGPGALPFYFGARDHRLGKVRTFSPPEGSGHAPVFLLSLESNALLAQGETDRSLEELLRSKSGTQRMLIDIPTAAESIALSLLPLAPTILVPLLPDMNSILNLAPLESIFAGRKDADQPPPAVMYLLNKFDVSLPLHLDVRELLQQQLGDRLLPFVIRRSPAVSEALAQGMTVIDYAPNAAVTQDYLRLATWLRSVSGLADTGLRGVRWSEQ